MTLTNMMAFLSLSISTAAFHMFPTLLTACLFVANAGGWLCYAAYVAHEEPPTGGAL